jgi:predicted PurR-regulated permease PerM
MTWWAWALVFLMVAVVGAAVLLVLARSLWRKASALFAEIGTVSDRIGEITARLDEVQAPTTAPDLAVFSEPSELRRAARRRSR